MVDASSGKVVPSVQKAIVHIQEKYGLTPSNALGIIADVANLVFGQSWKKERPAPGKAVRQNTEQNEGNTTNLQSYID